MTRLVSKTLPERNHSIYMSVVISIESYTQLDTGLASRVQEIHAQSRHLIATHRTWTSNWRFQYSYPHYNVSLFYTTSNVACFVKSPMCLIMHHASWDTTPCILNLDTRRVVSFTRRSFYSQEKSPPPPESNWKGEGVEPKPFWTIWRTQKSLSPAENQPTIPRSSSP